MINMTKYFTKKLFAEFYNLNAKLFLLIGVFTFYTTYNLSSLNTIGCSVFEYALLGMSDQYYFTFMFLILYIIIMAGFIKDSDAIFLSRSVRYYSYFISKLISIFIFTISLILLHAIIAIFIGLFKHSLLNTFSDNVSYFGYYEELISLYQSSFSTPLSALLAVCIYLSIGLCMITAVLILISHYYSEKIVVISEIIGYFLIVLVLQRQIDETIPFLFINNYIFLNRVLQYEKLHLFCLSSIIIVLFILTIANRQRTHIIKKLKQILSPFHIFGEMLSYKNIFIILGILLVLATLNTLSINNINVKTYFEYTMMQFWGYGLGYFNIISFLQMVIMNGLPLYFLSIYFENKSSLRNTVIIRYPKFAKWFLKLQTSMLMIVLAQLLIMSIFTYLIGLAHKLIDTKGNINVDLIYIGNPIINTIIGIILRTLEIMFVQMLFLVIRSLVRNSTTAFFAVMSMYLSVTVFEVKFNPFGLSSLCRIFELSDKGLSFNFNLSFLIFTGGYVMMYLYLIINKKMQINNYERN